MKTWLLLNLLCVGGATVVPANGSTVSLHLRTDPSTMLILPLVASTQSLTRFHATVHNTSVVSSGSCAPQKNATDALVFPRAIGVGTASLDLTLEYGGIVNASYEYHFIVTTDDASAPFDASLGVRPVVSQSGEVRALTTTAVGRRLIAAHHKTACIACCACEHFTKSDDCSFGDCGDGSHEFCWDPHFALHHYGKSCKKLVVSSGGGTYPGCTGTCKYIDERQNHAQ